MKKENSVKKRYFLLLFIGVILTLGLSSMQASSAASTVSVNTTGNDAHSGSSVSPYQTISVGINKVQNKGTVKLSPGTFNVNKSSSETDYGIIINKNVTIQGSGSTKTIIDAKGLSYIFKIQNANVVIRDLTIKNGKSRYGGAITNFGGSKLTLINCILTNNDATTFGGALYNSGTLTVTSSTLAANKVTSGYGSAVFNHYGSAEIHYNSIFENNGNAVYSDHGTVNAQNNWWGSNDNPGTELESFDDLTNWEPIIDGTTTSLDTVNGDTGIQVGGSNGTYPGIRKNVNYNFNGVAPNIDLWIYLSNSTYDTAMTPSNLIGIGFDFLTATSTKYFEGYLIKSQLHEGLNYVVIPQSRFVPYGGVTWKNIITSVQFRLFYEPGTAMNITFLEMKKNLAGTPKMVLTFDDGYTSVYTNAFPIMQKYGIKGTIYLNTAYVGQAGRLTLAQLHILYNAGWTIANHTPLHTDLITGSLTDPELDLNDTTILTVDQDKQIIQGGINWLLANGFTRGAYDFALPWGQYDANVLEALKECGIHTDRTIMLGMTGSPAGDLLQICQEGPNGGTSENDPGDGAYTTYQQADQFVDDTIQSQSSTFVMMHEIVTTPTVDKVTEWSTADFTKWIAYIVKTGIETDTVDEWYNSLVSYTPVNYGPWIVLKETSSNTTSYGTSNIIADFNHNSDGQDISSSGHVPNGLITKFSCDSLGTVNPVAYTVNGLAKTTFKAKYQSGNSTVKVTANSANAYTVVNIRDTVPPAVAKIDPANGAINIPTNKVIKVTFNEQIKAGTMWIVLKDGKGVTDPIKVSIYGNVLTVTPTSLLNKTQHTLYLHTGSITDMSGNNIKSYSSTFKVDTTPPVITKVDPANGAVNVAVNKVIRVTFNEQIKPYKVWIQLKNNSTGSMVLTSYVISGNVLYIKPSTTLKKGTSYTLIVHSLSVQDISGNSMNKPYLTVFKTAT